MNDFHPWLFILRGWHIQYLEWLSGTDPVRKGMLI